MCVLYTYIHIHICMCVYTYMCTHTTYMDAHLHSQPNLISETHATKRPSLKKQGICRHICMGTHTHVHLPMLTRIHTKNYLEGMPFEKQQWPRSMKTVRFLQEWSKVLGPFIMHQSNPWPSERGDCTCVDREKAWGNCPQRNNVRFIHYPDCSSYRVT